MSQISRQISILRQRIIVLNRIQVVALAMSVLGIGLAMAGAVDYVVHWPMAGRFIIFVSGIFLIYKGFQKWFRPIWNQKPSPTSVAIRVEQIEPGLQGLLASAIDFENGGVQKSNPLAVGIIQKASALWKQTRPNKHIRRSTAIYAVGVAWVVVGLWFASFYLAQQTTLTAIIRTLVPWSQTEWPPRLFIHAEMRTSHVAKGDTFMLRVKANEGQDPNKSSGVLVSARCETIEANGEVTTKTLELVAQSDGSWEKPIIAEGNSMSFVFFTDDTKTSPVNVVVVEPLNIQSAQLIIQPPTYAAKNREKVDMKWNGGTMPNLPAVLAGATASLDMDISAPLSPPRDQFGEVDATWLARTVVALDTNTNTGVGAIQFRATTPQQWNLSWTINNGVDIVVDPADENGIRGQQPLRTRIQVVIDQEPTVVISDPEQDEIVTKNASIPILIEARDDLALESVGFRIDRQQRSGEPAPKIIQNKVSNTVKSEAELKDVLRLNSMELQNGDMLLLRGTAQDAFENEGKKRNSTLSEPRKIRVVDQAVFEQNIRQQTSALRQNIARLEIGQKETRNEKEINNNIQSQKSVTDRIDQAQKTTSRLVNRLDRNGMKESNIAQALRDVEQQATRAATHSQNASQQLQQASQGNNEALETAKKEQDESLQAIQAMLDILDQDNDAAGAQRRADKVSQAIDQHRKELQEIAKKTAGRILEDLSIDEKKQLSDQAQKQKDTAQEAQALVEDLQERAERSKKKDPIQAEALENAANEGKKGDAAKKMEEAAERSEKNQSGAADDSMQDAAQTIEKIQKALKANQNAKKEELKRRISSLVETIRSLVVRAEKGRSDIDVFEDAQEDVRKSTQEKAEMLARNTTAAIEESKSAGRSTEAISKILERASDLENAVVVALRASPPQIGAAQEASSRGLELLKQALAKAEEVKQKQKDEEAEKERDELANKYREFARQEKILRQEVSTILSPEEIELDRRSAAISREVAERQKTLRIQISNIPNQSEMVKESAVFVKAHELIEEWMGSTQEQLAQTKPTPETVAQCDMVIESLEALANSLTDPEQKDDPFAQNQEEGGGMGGGGEQENEKKIPPLAELRLVRELQAQINRRTKVIEGVGANSPGATKAIADLSKLQNDVRLLGEEWVDKMKKISKPPTSGEKFNPVPKDNSSTPGFSTKSIHGAFIRFQEKNNSNANTEPPSQAPTNPDAKAAEPPKTLDELLGIGGGGGEKAAQAQRKENLERGLNEESLNDLADAALQDMRLAEKLVSEDRDMGIGTQRVQAQALSRLDALIDAAVKFEKSSSKKSSQKKSQKSKSSSQPESGSQPNPNGEKKPEGEESEKDGNSKSNKDSKGDKDKDERGDNNNGSGDTINPPEFEDAQLQADSAMNEDRAEWGRLPQRIREIMSQSRRDRISALYQKATEAYYRRMAEDRGP